MGRKVCGVGRGGEGSEGARGFSGTLFRTAEPSPPLEPPSQGSGLEGHHSPRFPRSGPGSES